MIGIGVLILGYEIVRGPFLLMETVAMLHKYVNGISFQTAISRQRFFMAAPDYLAQSARMSRLQTIMEELCAELDTADPRVQHYFACACGDPERVCLAQVMIHPFCTLTPGRSAASGRAFRTWATG